MDPQADSDDEFIVFSTSDYTDSASYPSAQAGGLKSNAKLFVKSIGSLPSLLEARVTECQASGTARTHIRKYSETMGRQIADHRSVTNYYINGGRGGSGGRGGDQGGDGGVGHGPTIYFGQPQEREPSEFRTIRLGDVKLVKEVVVGHQRQGVVARRIYHAQIRRDPGTVTVAMYQGDSAEKELYRNGDSMSQKYESIRHPNIMQLYGLVSTKGLYAMVFHYELIPVCQFLRRFEHSSILRTYIIGYCLIMKSTEFGEATNYIDDAIGYSMATSVWIRPSTRELCLDLAPSGPGTFFNILKSPVLRLENLSLDAPNSEDILISSLSDDQYHELCCQYPIARFPWFQVSTRHPVGPGIFRSDSQHETCVRIPEPLILPEAELYWNLGRRAPGKLLPNSWIRYDPGRAYTLRLKLQLSFWEHRIVKAWLAQASCIFTELQEVAHVEDYVCIHGVEFTLRITDEREIPEGYLFVCPPQDLRTSTERHASLYQWPACPAYWSLDPSGADRLSTEDARNLGFPAIHTETVVGGLSWDHSIYQGLRRFHEGKGFNPESQEVARRLGYPVFEASSDGAPFPAREAASTLLPYFAIARTVRKWLAKEANNTTRGRDGTGKDVRFESLDLHRRGARAACRRRRAAALSVRRADLEKKMINILDEDALDSDIPFVRDDLINLERGAHGRAHEETADCTTRDIHRPARTRGAEGPSTCPPEPESDSGWLAG
ncbi:hypothetical protein MSAN_01508800 [Mycena sanguinolenta]|uniref:Uncharacterized protein n=1 Tax=Mycena sanguinolenta TaxID=230812 RepID=A0A8H6Y7B3_9AGAR|nr:hypothetical protein MSAN_01508800 [Mycena sanguinolenta]